MVQEFSRTKCADRVELEDMRCPNRGTGGGLNCTLPDGTIIPSGPDTRFRRNVVALRTSNKAIGLNITPDTPIPKWYGETMDHQMAVLGLLQRE